MLDVVLDVNKFDVSEFIRIENERERRKQVFNHAIRVHLKFDVNKSPKPAIAQAADRLWQQYLYSTFYKSKKNIDIQRRILEEIYESVLLAKQKNGVVQYSRNKKQENDYYDTKMKMIDYCESIGMLKNEISSPRRPYTRLHESRLIPKPEFFETPQQVQVIKDVIKEIDNQRRDWIEIRTKVNGKKINLPVDYNNPFIKRRAKKLELMDKSWRLFKIWYKPLGIEKYKLLPHNQPFSVFTNDLDHGGRIYTQAGITTLRRIERPTLLIEYKQRKYKTVELDIKNLHPWLCYARLGINYQEDAYKVLTDLEMVQRGWDLETIRAFRELVKICFNAMLNGDSAISACNYKLAEAGKTGRNLERTREIINWMYLCRVPFKEIATLIRAKHPLLKDLFNNKNSTGLEFQRIDSDCTLEICSIFARQKEICLPIHDSYIVVEKNAAKLYRAIRDVYKRAVGFSPRIEQKT